MVTPNIPEAETLTGISIAGEASMQEAARVLHGMGAQHVLIKGGHAAGPEVVDLLFDGERFHPIRSKRLDTRNTHGTGCTLAAAIAAYLAKGESAVDAARKGIDYVHGAIAAGFALGRGHGPLNHFY
jgi:hydroxymethylpyrimidine kinase/phosphomethylpyrimidine kinase